MIALLYLQDYCHGGKGKHRPVNPPEECPHLPAIQDAAECCLDIQIPPQKFCGHTKKYATNFVDRTLQEMGGRPNLVLWVPDMMCLRLVVALDELIYELRSDGFLDQTDNSLTRPIPISSDTDTAIAYFIKDQHESASRQIISRLAYPCGGTNEKFISYIQKYRKSLWEMYNTCPLRPIYKEEFERKVVASVLSTK